MQKFVNVIIPLTLEGVFTYHIPPEMTTEIFVGQRIVVPFGGKKLYTAIVESIHYTPPELYKTKPVYSVLENYPMVLPQQIEFWKWISEYYICSLGEVYRNAFPTALKLESETFIRKSELDFSWNDLDEKETFVMQSLMSKSSTNLKELEAFLPKKYIITTLKNLYDKQLIEIDEQLIEKYKAKIVSYIQLNPELEDEEKMKTVLNSLTRAEKQREIFFQFIQLKQQRVSPIEKKEVVQLSSPAVVKALTDKNIFQEYQLQKDRIDLYDDDIEDSYDLSNAQNKAIQSIEKEFVKCSYVMLHGITSSGKTEIYFQLIEKNIQQKKNTLFLLPEISITLQLVNKIKKRFGDEVGVYHSKLSQNERVEVWQKTLNNEYKIIIGARSAIFLPFQNMGLFIVDEEHDSSYKQNDLKPYYNARDCVQILAKQFKAKVLFGSATPSMESYFNHSKGKIGWVELSERYGNSELPEIELVDLRKTNASANISFDLKEKITESLQTKNQVILFHNRRGFSPVVECNHCGYSPTCPNCDVSLTYHKISSSLKCHYCGYTMAVPRVCPKCHEHSLETKGIGTQQIEEELNLLFPQAKIERMDVDTMRKKHAHEILYEKMQEGEIDILIGTQMITKGLDFGKVNLVGVIRADSMLNLPNFRAEEKTIQMLIQVSGRSGRRENKGKVIIQTFQPDNPLFLFVKEHQYNLAEEAIIAERKEFNYPPFFRIIDITFKHKKEEICQKASQIVKKYMEQFVQENRLMGETPGIIPRINNQYIYKVLIKNPVDKSFKSIKKQLKYAVKELQQMPNFKNVRVEIDVDPV